MTPDTAVRVWKPLYLHFTQDKFDAFTDKCRITDKELDKHKKRLILFSKCFEKDIDGSFFLISNYINNDFTTPFEIDKSKFEIYTDWIRRRESISYVFEKEFRYFKDNYTDNELEVNYASDSKILKDYLSGKLSAETLILMDKYHKSFIDRWSERDMINIVSQRFFILKKYRRFVKHDKDKIQKIILNI
jgi:hypothetical protein